MTDQEPADSYSLATNRSRRSKNDKQGRTAALERFREARHGQRSKFDIIEERNIYEEVDEAEYSKIVRSRQDDDWIVDDGTGYVEDGREIFDDDLDEDQPQLKKKRGSSSANASSNKATKNPNIRPTDSKPSGIRQMFAAAAVKPKVQKAVSLEDDDILGDIMGELKNSEDMLRPAPVTLPKRSVLGQSRVSGSSESGSQFRNGQVGLPSRPRSAVVQENDENNKAARASLEGKLSSGKKPEIRQNMPNKNKLNERKLVSDTVVKAVSQDSTKKVADEKTFSDEEICAYESQNVMVNEHQSQMIEDDEDEADMSAMCDDVDVAGIDFNDNFEQESTNTHKPSKTDVCSTADNTSALHILSSSNCDVADVTIDSSKLPLMNVDGRDILRIFWLDAFEDHLKQPGVVYLFGKVWVESASTHVSCCLTIKNIERRIFLLPRKYHFDTKTRTEDVSRPVSYMDVYQEFNSLSERYKIMTFKSMKVSKQYAFDKADVPDTCEYLEVRYSAALPALPSDLSGQTFSHVFATNTSALESFLLERKIKGPSWLDITGAQVSTQPISWCRLEANVNGPDSVRLVESSKVPAPPLVVMAMTMKTAPHPKTHQNEIVAFAGLVHNSYSIDRSAPKPPFQSHFCAVAPPTNCIFPFDFRDRVKGINNSSGQSQAPSIEVIASERGLLGFILAKIHKIDPDVIIGHDVAGYDFDVFLHRIAQNKLPHWSKLGRLKRANMPKFGSRLGSSAPAAGRLVLDTMISARELIRCRSYDLTELVSHVLKEHRRVYDGDEVRAAFSNTQKTLELLESTVLDATFSLRIASDLSVLPLAAQITNICGNVLSRTLAGGRSERNEYLLLHAFTERNFIVPDKVYGKKPIVNNELDADDDDDGNAGDKKGKSSRRKPAYAGGLVLEPKRGFYDRYILLVDFNSLYPSIIQEFNICFTTVSVSQSFSKGTMDDEDVNDAMLPEPGQEPGVLPTEIRRLVESRKQVRQLMKVSNVSPDQLAQYDIRQRALKLTANSLYGCLGFTQSRFYARRLAAMVTGKGREILLKTKDLVQALNLDVIYGDTDSLMIATGTNDIDEVYRIGNRIKSEVNKLYRHLEIDIDGVYQSMLLLKKKKYAALSVERVGDKLVTKQEMKGLDMVRRDWCTLAKDCGIYVVGQILSGESRETVLEMIHTHLSEVGNAVRAGEIGLEAFTITKQLTKNPEDYPDRKSLSHVQVAIRLNSASGNTGRKMRAGDTVAYIVCDDGSTLPATQRAYHPDLEFAKRSDLKVDVRYYLEHQVHPVVARLCDPIEGTDAARIAECLGLDATGFRQALRKVEDDEDALLGVMEESDADKYRDCERFSFPCHQCGTEIVVDSVENSEDKTLKLAECAKCKACPLSNLAYLSNRLTLAMRRQISRYYEGWLICEDAACGTRTRRTTLTLNRGQPVCTSCHHGILRPEVSEKSIYLQFGFFKHIFDVSKVEAVVDSDYRCCLDRLKFDVDRVLAKSAFSEVNLARLFEGLFPNKLSK